MTKRFRPTSTVTFNNVFQRYIEIYPAIYSEFVTLAFNDISNYIVTNKYLLIINMFREHFAHFITSKAERYYYDLYSFLVTEVASYEVTDDINQMLVYVKNHKDDILMTLPNLVIDIVVEITHQLYNYALTCANGGVSFSEFELKIVNHTTATVRCYVNMESIKKHDEQLYDRLTLFA